MILGNLRYVFILFLFSHEILNALKNNKIYNFINIEDFKKETSNINISKNLKVYSDQSSDDLFSSTPLASLSKLIDYTNNKNNGNLPDVFGIIDINQIDLQEVKKYPDRYNYFPIKLLCKQNSGCDTRLEIGKLNNDFFQISAFDDYTKNKINFTIKFTKSDGTVINLDSTQFTLEQISGENEIIKSSSYININPSIKSNHNGSISILNLPLISDSYYQICNSSGQSCSNKKPLFDKNYSGNKIREVNFWKLIDKSYISPGVSLSYTFSYTNLITKRTSTETSWSIGVSGDLSISKGEKNGISPSFGVGVNYLYQHVEGTSTAYQNGTSYTRTLTFTSPPCESNKPSSCNSSAIGDYVLFTGVIADFPNVKNFVNDINDYITKNEKKIGFQFSVIKQFTDSYSNTDISVGTILVKPKLEINNKTFDNVLIDWSVIVPGK